MTPLLERAQQAERELTATQFRHGETVWTRKDAGRYADLIAELVKEIEALRATLGAILADADDAGDGWLELTVHQEEYHAARKLAAKEQQNG